MRGAWPPDVQIRGNVPTAASRLALLATVCIAAQRLGWTLNWWGSPNR